MHLKKGARAPSRVVFGALAENISAGPAHCVVHLFCCLSNGPAGAPGQTREGACAPFFPFCYCIVTDEEVSKKAAIRRWRP